MRICILSEYFYPDQTGGTGTVLSHLARQLRDEYSHLQLEAITSRNLYRGEGVRPSTFENWHGLKILRLNTPKSNRSSTALRLAMGAAFSAAVAAKLESRWLSRVRYDALLVVTNPPVLPLAARTFGRRHGVPYIYLIHDLYPDVATALGVLPHEHIVAAQLRRQQRAWLHGAAKVVVLGRCMRDYLVENYEVPQERIEVIPNWSDPAMIRRRGHDTRFKAQHGLSGPVILYAGNFGQYQDFDGILDAAKLLQSTGSRATFVLVGEGAKKEYLAGRIEREKIDNVRLFPFVANADFEDLLASADISLVTLEPGAEGLGVPSKFYNILASGRPTVAVVAPGSEVARVVAEENCGVQVAPQQPALLADTLSKLLSDETTLDSQGINARRACEQKYTLQHAAAAFHRVFEEVGHRR